MAVGGDAHGVGELSRRYGAAASNFYRNGNTLETITNQLNPSTWSGPAGQKMGAYTAWMRSANHAISKAFDTVASFLPRVQDAITSTQKAEADEIRAAEAYQKAEKALTDAQTALSTAELNLRSVQVAAASPTPALSPMLAPLGLSGPEAEAAVQTATTNLRTAEHNADTAKRDFDRARHHFEEENRHRLSLLKQLARLCHDEIAALQSYIPDCPVPDVMGLDSSVAATWIVSEISTIQQAEGYLRDVMPIARSWDASALVPKLHTLLLEPDQVIAGDVGIGRNGTLTVERLAQLANMPLPHFVKRHVSSGGSVFDWVGAGLVLVVSGGLIIATDGADSEVVGAADRGAIASLLGGSGSTAVGVGGISGEAFSALDNVIHGSPIDPEGMLIAGTSGWIAGAIPVGLSSKVLDEAPGLKTLLTTGAVTGSGLNAAGQLIEFHHIDIPTVIVNGVAGAYGGAVPGPGFWQIAPPGIATAATDGAGPAPAPAPAPKAHHHEPAHAG